MPQNEGHVQSLEKGLKILEALAAAAEGVGLSDLSRRLGLNKSTVYRMLTTLKAYGYVDQEPVTGKYILGLKILDLSGSLLDRLDVRTIAHPYLKELAARSQEVAHMVVRDGPEAVYVDKVEGNRTIRMYSQIGRRVALHSTAVGKAILAFLPPEEVEKIIASRDLPRFTPRTITTLPALHGELEQVRQRGYAIDDGENEEGIRCVGAPIFDYRGQVVAALSISGPTVHVTPERVPELGQLVRWAGEEISRRLGYKQE
ncbi:Transcription regulator IclR, C-terminal [Moorella glycerini]|uniref:Glycerol operon regulatory protein n=1 Tax=Neomoorella stamsii TaxID=1266720 RepID=A0A9X7J5K8_9FIRM|nr:MULTISPECIES: IclR family transcriptional regulator [Moorella]PRR74834.1 Transcriptional regulator KdgR [Moorella stamsii]CEP67980.1 Transcription regulator IclR, C-terminal [Moorella glycerini]